MRKLPESVFKKHGAYYFVKAVGSKRKWIRLCRVSDGLPSMYSALSALLNTNSINDSMPAVIDSWMVEVMPKHAKTTQTDDVRYCNALKVAFKNFKADQVEAPDIIEALKNFKDKPRTYNAYRSQVRELMRFAIEKGFRTNNPVVHIKTMSTPPRKRYITDSELRRIKIAALKPNGEKTRSGEIMCAVIDLAYLTGQRQADIAAVKWSQLTKAGIAFETEKTKSRIIVSWTPALRKLEQRLVRLKESNVYVFSQPNGSPYVKGTIARYWVTACKKAEIEDAHFHDIRAKAITDKEEKEGLIAAQHMGGHTTQKQTVAYVRQLKPRTIGATR